MKARFLSYRVGSHTPLFVIHNVHFIILTRVWLLTITNRQPKKKGWSILRHPYYSLLSKVITEPTQICLPLWLQSVSCRYAHSWMETANKLDAGPLWHGTWSVIVWLSSKDEQWLCLKDRLWSILCFVVAPNAALDTTHSYYLPAMPILTSWAPTSPLLAAWDNDMYA